MIRSVAFVSAVMGKDTNCGIETPQPYPEYGQCMGEDPQNEDWYKFKCTFSDEEKLLHYDGEGEWNVDADDECPKTAAVEDKLTIEVDDKDKGEIKVTANFCDQDFPGMKQLGDGLLASKVCKPGWTLKHVHKWLIDGPNYPGKTFTMKCDREEKKFVAELSELEQEWPVHIWENTTLCAPLCNVLDLEGQETLVDQIQLQSLKQRMESNMIQTDGSYLEDLDCAFNEHKRMRWICTFDGTNGVVKIQKDLTQIRSWINETDVTRLPYVKTCPTQDEMETCRDMDLGGEELGKEKRFDPEQLAMIKTQMDNGSIKRNWYKRIQCADYHSVTLYCKQEGGKNVIDVYEDPESYFHECPPAPCFLKDLDTTQMHEPDHKRSKTSDGGFLWVTCLSGEKRAITCNAGEWSESGCQSPSSRLLMM